MLISLKIFHSMSKNLERQNMKLYNLFTCHIRGVNPRPCDPVACSTYYNFTTEFYMMIEYVSHYAKEIIKMELNFVSSKF